MISPKMSGDRYKKNHMEGIMLQTIKGFYPNGKLELEEEVNVKKKVPVLVAFLKEDRGDHLSASPHDSSSKNFLRT